MNDRRRRAAMFLAPHPIEDIEALLDAAASRSPGEPDAPVWRTANAAAVLSRVERRTAWRLLAWACEWRIGRIRTAQALQLGGEPRTPWSEILWANALTCVDRAGDADPGVVQMARALTATAPWSGSLIELLFSARAVLGDEPAPPTDWQS